MKITLPKILIIGCIITLSILATPKEVSAQAGNTSIYISPTQGTFEVGSTFDISIFLNTGGTEINTIQLDLGFSPDKLQVVKPTAGQSFISIWISQPSFSNTEGRLSLQGGLPTPGINTSAGLVTTITFRAVSSGYASVSVLNSSRVLANDGHGTDLPVTYGSAQYTISIPPPGGPLVVSSTHPDQNKWYKNTSPIFSWKLEQHATLDETASVDLEDDSIQYSWEFDQDPLNIPDNTSEGKKRLTSYEEVDNGMWYFHIKARVEGMWGNTTHYLVQIDNKPPAVFSLNIDPENNLPNVRRSVDFLTTDEHSGIDHYGIKIEAISGDEMYNTSFIEASSPWQIPALTKGEYKVIVRAYDRAGNYTDSETDLNIRRDILTILRFEGIHFGNTLISWGAILIPLIAVLVVLGRFLLKWRKKKVDPSSQIEEYLETTKKKMQAKEQEYLKQKVEQDEIQDMFTKKFIETPEHETEKSTPYQTPQASSNE